MRAGNGGWSGWIDSYGTAYAIYWLTLGALSTSEAVAPTQSFNLKSGRANRATIHAMAIGL